MRVDVLLLLTQLLFLHVFVFSNFLFDLVPKTAGTVGFDCTSGPTVCTALNSECSSLKACKCKTDFWLNVTNGQCGEC